MSLNPPESEPQDLAESLPAEPLPAEPLPAEPLPAEPRPAEPRRPSSLQRGSMFTAGLLVVLALFVMVNYLGLRHYKRFDWTASQLYTLTEKSETVIKAVDRDIDIILLLNPQSDLYVAAGELVDRVVAANPRHIRRRDLDAAKDLLAVQRLVDRHDIRRDNVIVVAGADDKRVIGEYELAEYDYSRAQYGEPPTLQSFKGEQLIVSALLSLQEADKPSILFTAGHGEAPLTPGDPRSLSQAREILGGDNFDIREWAEPGQAVPPDTDLVVIAGPTANFLPPELEALDRYLKRGGRLLVFADPAFENESTELKSLGLEDWLTFYGVRLGRDLVVDPAGELPFYGPETLFTDQYGDHVIVETPRQTRTRVLMPLVRSVSALAENPASAEVTELVKTSADGWGETGLDAPGAWTQDGDDLPGPVSVAVAVAVPVDGTDGMSESPEEARLVVFGDLDWAADPQLANGANGVLLLNTFNWLVEREELIDIEGKAPQQSRLTLLDGELFMLYALFVLLLPALAACAGIWIALQRRR